MYPFLNFIKRGHIINPPHTTSNNNMTDTNQLPESLTEEQATVAGAGRPQKFAKVLGILLGRDLAFLGNPIKSIKSNPELVSYFHDFTDFELECFHSLLEYEATDPVNGVQAVIGKALSWKCMKSMSFTSCCAHMHT